eukprot:TRINITY_DN2635_c0_g1_i2.p1 TRINITY_DN2635_c0_g1~~TRINITY_DN2635_c0_g1_i2.p1  ORF type:complete len:220 (+),score=35.42 TRINITY_DN2635_c0_g1_i2:161-820(+)
MCIRDSLHSRSCASPPAAPEGIPVQRLALRLNQLRAAPPIVQPHQDPPFVRTSWVKDAVSKILPWYRLQESPNSSATSTIESKHSRIPPTAFVATQHAGKTRATQEVLNYLQTKESIPCIYISLNSSTEYYSNECSTPLDSILTRIAWAIAEEQGELHSMGYLRISCSEAVICEWLGQNPCILAIDELSRLCKPEQFPDDQTKSPVSYTHLTLPTIYSV